MFRVWAKGNTRFKGNDAWLTSDLSPLLTLCADKRARRGPSATRVFSVRASLCVCYTSLIKFRTDNKTVFPRLSRLFFLLSTESRSNLAMTGKQSFRCLLKTTPTQRGSKAESMMGFFGLLGFESNICRRSRCSPEAAMVWVTAGAELAPLLFPDVPLSFQLLMWALRRRGSFCSVCEWMMMSYRYVSGSILS